MTDAGVLMRQPVSAIRSIGRVTQGVRLVKLDAGTTISSITRVIHEDEAQADADENPDENEEGQQLTIEGTSNIAREAD
jgi:DNA gyrase subunit A